MHSVKEPTSLAILSSPTSASFGAPPTPILLQPSPSPSPSKRPKLSLNTTSVSVSTFGKGSTSLRLDTLSATSPTSRNTFRNAYAHQQQQASCALARQSTPSPLGANRSAEYMQTTDDAPEHFYDSAASSASTASISSVESFSDVPYKLVYSLPSVLVNSPLPRERRKKTSFGQSRPMFPAVKKVNFRTPLTEDIRTTKYTLKHSDIDSSTSTISTLELSSSDNKTEPDELEKQDGEHSTSIATEKPGATPDADPAQHHDEADHDTCPSTPVAGREKRDRCWTWTLGSTGSATSGQTDEVDADHEDRD